MSLGNETHCWECGRRRDGSATYESEHSTTYSSWFTGPEARRTTAQGTRSSSTHTIELGTAVTYGTYPEFIPAVYGPASYWYCCQCWDGPHNITLQPRCTCGHDRCKQCKLA